MFSRNCIYFKFKATDSGTIKAYSELISMRLIDTLQLDEKSMGNSEKPSILNSEIYGDIKNLTTSFLINSIATDLAPTKSNIIANKTSSNEANIKIHPPLVNDLNVSKFEFDLYRQSLIETARYQETQLETGELLNPSCKLRVKSRGNKVIKFGDCEMESCFKSPYPDEFWQLDQLFICPCCLNYMKSNWILSRHREKCAWKHPPGREIYRKDLYSFFEVDGKANKTFCQNLCLLAKLFLDHKTLYFGN